MRHAEVSDASIDATSRRSMATRGEAVGQRHAIEAVARELIKMGKQVSRVHFGDYYQFVRELQ